MFCVLYFRMKKILWMEKEEEKRWVKLSYALVYGRSEEKGDTVIGKDKYFGRRFTLKYFFLVKYCDPWNVVITLYHKFFNKMTRITIYLVKLDF